MAASTSACLTEFNSPLQGNDSRMTSSPYSQPVLKNRRDIEREQALERTRQFQAIDLDIQDGRLSDAAQALTRLQSEDAEDVRVYVAGWLLARRAGKEELAMHSARCATEIAPAMAMPHYCLAESLRTAGDLTAAQTAIDEAQRLEPGNLKFRESAINLAMFSGNFRVAEILLRRTIEQSPSIPGLKTLLASSLRNQGKQDEAQHCFNEALQENHDDAHALYGLAMLAFARGDLGGAQAHVERAIQIKPEDAELHFLQQVFVGETPAGQPPSMIRAIADEVAARYDAEQSAAGYDAPSKIAGRIIAQYPNRNLNILDLGCGTGLLGKAVGRIGGHFAGVDLSQAMLEHADRRKSYARLHRVDIRDALAATQADNYDVVVAADVLAAVGPCEDLLNGAFKVLKPGGTLYVAARSSHEPGASSTLEKDLGYSHGTNRFLVALREAGFVDPELDEVVLRTIAGKPVAGFIAQATKPG